MLDYEENRTESIVKRLVAIARLIRREIISNWVIGLGVTGGVVGYMLAPSGGNSWVLFGVAGMALGYVTGHSIASMITVHIEWMAQMLVVQENILDELRQTE